MAASDIGFHRGSSRRLAATVVLGILARCGDSFVLPRAAPDALRPLGARGWAASVDRGSHERARRRPGLTCVSAAESVAARGGNSLGEDSLASNVQVRVADADDVPRLSWVVTDVFVSEWKGPLQRPATWVQRQRMWVNVFLSMLTRIVCASFFLGLDIGEEARRSGVSVDVVEGAADARDAGSVGEAPPRAPVISHAATHRLFMTVVPGDGGTETVSGVIEVNCRKYPLPANASLLPDWGQEERPYISNLAVLPEYRGQGMANALMRAVEEEVRQWGYSDVVLDVDCNNLAALQLYHRRGYVAEFVDPATRKVRRAFMRKQLSPVHARVGAHLPFPHVSSPPVRAPTPQLVPAALTIRGRPRATAHRVQP